jgi:hypothetical protein
MFGQAMLAVEALQCATKLLMARRHLAAPCTTIPGLDRAWYMKYCT